MKKLILLLLMAVATGGSAWAQKGMFGVGANIAIPTEIEGFFSLGGGLKFQYNISDYFRIEPSVSGYYVVYANEAGIDMSALLNTHIFFSSPKDIRVYAIVGGGMAHYFVDEEYEKDYTKDGDYNYNHKGIYLGANVGLGLDWRLTHSLSLQVETTAFIGSLIAFWPTVGITYNF